VLRSALRRLFVLFAVIVALTGALSLAIGAVAHANLARAVAVGFYVAGAAVLVGSFVFGMRGPIRADWGEAHQVDMPLRRAGFMPRAIRRTTSDERADAKLNSLALFALGIALILIGASFDPARNSF
jgi:hypothetical protein